MRFLLVAVSSLLAVACVAENEAFRAVPYAAESDAVADLATRGDLAACGRDGLPCCLDAAGRVFCLEGACGERGCYLPDMMTPPDLTPSWRPDLTGGQCVEACGACTGNYQCCASPSDPMNCVDEHGGIVQNTGLSGKCAIGVGLCDFP